MTCPKCKCEECAKEYKPGGRTDCKFCKGTGVVQDRLGFYTCFCVKGAGPKTG